MPTPHGGTAAHCDIPSWDVDWDSEAVKGGNADGMPRPLVPCPITQENCGIVGGVPCHFYSGSAPGNRLPLTIIGEGGDRGLAFFATH
jgi:hypothetical protein